jgi:hypothetical protein
MRSIEGKEVPEGTMVWVAGFEGKDNFWKPIPKRLNFNFTNFYADFQVCVEYCKLLNSKK